MKVTLLEPHGFCGGVENAIQTAYRAKRMHPTKQIYLIGALVHNENVMEKLQRDGFTLFEGDEGETKRFLSNLPFGSVVCFSAHGHPKVYEEAAKERGAILFDATCPYVKRNEQEIAKALEEGKKVLFIGKKGHAEALGALSLDEKNVFLFDEGLPLERFAGEEVSIFSQTTMSEGEVDRLLKKAETALRNVDFHPTRCFDAKNRQKAISDIGNEDACIILGSKKSNNSQELLALAKEKLKGKPCFLVLSKEELEGLPLKGDWKVALGSGASSSKEDVTLVKDYLESL